MRIQENYTDYHDHFEYFGNTEIERIRKQGNKTIRHDWIIFDTVEEVNSKDCFFFEVHLALLFKDPYQAQVYIIVA